MRKAEETFLHRYQPGLTLRLFRLFWKNREKNREKAYLFSSLHFASSEYIENAKSDT